MSGIELASNWFFSSNLYDDGKTSKYEQQNVVAKVDGKMIDLLALNLIEELKGKVELTYRYTAFNLPMGQIFARIFFRLICKIKVHFLWGEPLQGR